MTLNLWMTENLQTDLDPDNQLKHTLNLENLIFIILVIKYRYIVEPFFQQTQFQREVLTGPRHLKHVFLMYYCYTCKVVVKIILKKIVVTMKR